MCCVHLVLRDETFIRYRVFVFFTDRTVLCVYRIGALRLRSAGVRSPENSRSRATAHARARGWGGVGRQITIKSQRHTASAFAQSQQLLRTVQYSVDENLARGCGCHHLLECRCGALVASGSLIGGSTQRLGMRHGGGSHGLRLVGRRQQPCAQGAAATGPSCGRRNSRLASRTTAIISRRDLVR